LLHLEAVALLGFVTSIGSSDGGCELQHYMSNNVAAPKPQHPTTLNMS
jgi:hypothetical protein